MNSPLDDTTLTAYALKELGEADRSIVEKVLETDPAARQAVEAYRAAARLSVEAYQQEAKPALTDDQRQGLLAQAAESASNSPDAREPTRIFRKRRWAIPAVAAAGLALVIGMTAFLSGNFAQEAVRQAGISVHDLPVETRLALYDRKSAVRGEPLDGRRGVFAGDGIIGDRMKSAEIALNAPAPGGYGSFGGGMVGGYGGGATANVDVNGNAEEPVRAGILPPDGAPIPQEAPALPAGETPDRYLIRNARLDLEAEDAEKAAQKITETVRAAGGHVSGLNKRVDELGRPFINLTVRIPADRLDQNLNLVKTLGRVIHEQMSTDDVTEEYVDLEARIRNLKKTEERLLDHLGKALLIDSTLKIEQELTRVREQLERFEGRIRFLGHRVRYSTIEIKIMQKPKAEPLAPVTTFSSAHVLAEAVRSLIEFCRTIWTKIIWLGVWSPVWALALVVVLLVFRRLRNRILSWRRK